MNKVKNRLNVHRNNERAKRAPIFFLQIAIFTLNTRFKVICTFGHELGLAEWGVGAGVNFEDLGWYDQVNNESYERYIEHTNSKSSG